MFDQLRRRDQALFLTDPANFAPDDPECQRHESGTKTHNGKERIAVAVPGAGGAENSES